MCEICGRASKERVCEECLELLDYADASVFNRFLNSLGDEYERRTLKRQDVELNMELDYEDTS